MFNKRYRFIWGIILTIATTFNGVANGAARLNDVEKTFYREHKDLFVQKTFLENPEEMLFSSKQLFFDAVMFLIPASLSVICTETPRAWNRSTTYPHQKIRNLTIVTLVGAISLWLYSKHVKNSIKKETIQTFLRQYDSDLQRLEDDN